jgi:hypothetical protein
LLPIGVIGAVRVIVAVRSLLTSYPLLYAVLTLAIFIFLCLLIIGIATKSGSESFRNRRAITIIFCCYDLFILRRAGSPDFVPIAICRFNFSNLYFPVFVDYWNGYEVRRLRRAITIIFCYYDLFILRRAGRNSSCLLYCKRFLLYRNINNLLFRKDHNIFRKHLFIYAIWTFIWVNKFMIRY